MDISDILRGLNDPHTDLDPFTEESSPSANTNNGQADLQALTRAWVNERGSTELLTWPKNNLIERATASVKAQISLVEQLTGDMDPKTNFALIIIQTEVERWKFLVRSLLRARLAKIDKHLLYYLRESQEGEGRGRLGEQERVYAERHQGLLEQHYGASFLGAFPEGLRGLDDRKGGVDMVEGPDLDGAVFVRGIGVVKEGKGEMDEDGVVRFRVRGRDGDGVAEVGRGEVVVGRWRDVRDAVERGELELI